MTRGESGFSSLKAESSPLKALRCSKRLIKLDAIDTALYRSWISAGHVHGQRLALKNSYMSSSWKTHIDGCFMPFVLNIRACSSIELLMLNTVFLKRLCF